MRKARDRRRYRAFWTELLPNDKNIECGGRPATFFSEGPGKVSGRSPEHFYRRLARACEKPVVGGGTERFGPNYFRMTKISSAEAVRRRFFPKDPVR